MIRRQFHLLAALLALLLALPGPATALASSFPDVPPEAYYAEAVTELAARGIVRGYADGSFAPGDILRRSQAATTLARALGWSSEPGIQDFPDRGETDDESWAAVRALADRGIVRGYPDGTFDPGGILSRQHAIAMVARAMIVRGMWQAQSGSSPYGDVAVTHQIEVATYAHYAGAVPAAGQAMGAEEPAERGWYAAMLWNALRTMPKLPAPALPAVPKPPAPALPTVPGTLRTFHVAPGGDDAGPGSEAHPWRTLRHAAASLVAGDTAIVEDGIYREEPVSFGHNGTPSHRITLLARHQWGAVLVATDHCAPKIGIATSYVTVQGLYVTQEARCGEYTSRDAAVYCWPGAVGCWVRGLKQDTMHIGMKTNQDYSLFEGNTAADMLETFNSFGSIIRGNTILLSHNDGITTKGGSRSNQIYNNTVRVVGNADRAIVLGGNSSCCFYDPVGYEGYNHVAFNNVVVVAGGTVATALEVSGCAACTFTNNTVIGAQYAFYARAGGTGAAVQNPTPVFRNNIVVGSAQARRFESARGAVVDYNLFHNTPGVPAQAHGVSGDPLFVDPGGDWRLRSGSPAAGAGAAITVVGFNGEPIDVGYDRDGRPRAAPWDIGAYAAP